MSRQARLNSLSDSELLERLRTLVERHRKLDAEVVAHIAEVDERKLYLGRACSSMFAYCIELLHFSEAEAYLRSAVARASRSVPVLLAMLGDGRLHLSGIARLAPHLDAGNIESVTERAAHMSKREIDRLVAELSPRPDVRARMRKLPARARSSSDQPRPDRVDRCESARVTREECLPVVAPARVTAPVTAPMPRAEARPAMLELGGCGARSNSGSGGAKLEPIAPSRYKVEFTASTELRDKLQRARALLRHKISDSSNDLAEVVDEAVTLLLAKLEARKFAKTKAPRKSVADSDTSASSRTIPAAVKREVFARDEGKCAFVAESGRRCSCSDPGRLEYHHVHPYAMGGDHSPETIELRCKAHNAYQAELDYGKEAMKLAQSARRNGTTRASESSLTHRWRAHESSRPRGCEWPLKARAGGGGSPKGPRSLAPAVSTAGGGRPLAAPRLTAA